MSFPVFVTNAHDGTNRLFILEKAGVIKVLQPGGTNPAVFLDLTAKVEIAGERGLLGLAFHPSFATNRRFFVFYTRSPDGTIVIAEYLVSSSNPNVAETTETVILAAIHPPEAIRMILQCLALPSRAPPIACASPDGDSDERVIF